jgi:hypothetical protein
MREVYSEIPQSHQFQRCGSAPGRGALHREQQTSLTAKMILENAESLASHPQSENNPTVVKTLIPRRSSKFLDLKGKFHLPLCRLFVAPAAQLRHAP